MKRRSEAIEKQRKASRRALAERIWTELLPLVEHVASRMSAPPLSSAVIPVIERVLEENERPEVKVRTGSRSNAAALKDEEVGG